MAKGIPWRKGFSEKRKKPKGVTYKERSYLLRHQAVTDSLDKEFGKSTKDRKLTSNWDDL